jgi:hypothetical protein
LKNTLRKNLSALLLSSERAKQNSVSFTVSARSIARGQIDFAAFFTVFEGQFAVPVPWIHEN